ncbi:hypothetical protein [Maricaulis sp. CAU 1757]
MSIVLLSAALFLQEADLRRDQTPVQNTGVETRVENAEPVETPVTAADLIAEARRNWQDWHVVIAQLAARRAQERYLAELTLPAISSPAIDAESRSEVLSALHPLIERVETSNTGWAVEQLTEIDLVGLWTVDARAGSQLISLAERDQDNAGAVVTALGPVARAGLIDGQAYAERADALARQENRPQPYGTATDCSDGTAQIWQVEAPDALDTRREALGLLPFDVDQVIAAAGPCPDPAED